MAAVHHHGELDGRGTAEVHEGVERRADGAAGEQDVVHEHDVAAVDVKRDVGRVQDRRDGAQHVVAVEADVERADLHLAVLDLCDLVGEQAGDLRAAAHDAHEGDVVHPLVALHDLVRDAREGPVERLLVHDASFGLIGSHGTPFTKNTLFYSESVASAMWIGINP